MVNFTQFNAVFPSEGLNPYDQTGIREIETCRRTFNGVLFIDRILRALGIDSKVYPPKGDHGLRALHQQICDTQIPPHPKLSVFFYLLCDYDGLRGAKSALAEEFATLTALPKKYQTLMKGLWHMDRQEFRFALEHLAHPSLPSEFADEIITVLIQHAENGDYSLPLAYYHATQPVLKTSEALMLFFAALAQTSITDALFFSRKHHESAQRPLFEKLMSLVLEDQAVTKRAKELVSLPLNNTEDKWLQDYLGTGEGRKSKIARPILELRNIVTGRQRGPVTLRGFGDMPAPALARPLRGAR